MAIEWVDGWQAPGVRALVTRRRGAGVSRAPFDTFNLGDRCGDDPAAVAANRAALVELAGLPAEPRWLRQVHGTHAHRFAASDTGNHRHAGPAAGNHRHAGPAAGNHRHAGTVGAGVAGDRAAPALSEGPGEPEGSGRRQRRLLQSRVPPASVPEADAAVTSDPGIVLAILTADCLPVVLAARDGSAVAVAHAGWRGLAGGVLEATVAAMRTPAAGLEAWLGPAAGPAAYEVGDEVRAAFLACADAGRAGTRHPLPPPHGGGGLGWGQVLAPGQHPSDLAPLPASPRFAAEAAFVATRPGHWLCDLYALARLRLAAAGVTAVRGGGHCTISEPEAWFSHRRDGASGRMATLAWIAPWRGGGLHGGGGAGGATQM